MPSEPAHHDPQLEAGLVTSTDEKKTAGKDAGFRPPYSRPTETLPERMPPPRHLLVVVAICLLVTLSFGSVVKARIRPCPEHEGAVGATIQAVQQDAETEADGTSFPQLLRSASPDILHRLLHAYFPDRYKHGVYPSDHDALAAVHADDAALATRVAQLARRQGANNSTSTPPDTRSSEPPDSTPDPTPKSTPPTAQTDPPTPDPTPTDTPTKDPEPGTSPEGTSSSEPDSSSSNEPFTSLPDDSPSSTPNSPASPETSSSDPGPTTTTTKGRTPSSSPVPRTFTSTLPNGDVTVVTQTSWAVVYPDETGGGSQPTAGLQNTAPKRGADVVPIVVAAIFGALAVV